MKRREFLKLAGATTVGLAVPIHTVERPIKYAHVMAEPLTNETMPDWRKTMITFTTTKRCDIGDIIQIEHKCVGVAPKDYKVTLIGHYG